LFDGDRFEHVGIETGLLRPASVVRSAVTRQGDDEGVRGFGPLPEAAGDLVPVDARQTEIQQDGIGVKTPRCLEAAIPVVRNLDLVSEELQEERHGFSGIDVVLDDEDTADIPLSGIADAVDGGSRQLPRMSVHIAG
jgi:hypothetical protein